MITRTKSVAGVPAAQRQPKDRQQRRRQKQKKQPSDGDDSRRKVDGQHEVAKATVIDLMGPKRNPRHPAISQNSTLVKDRQTSRHPGRKQHHVDIHI